jgi:hypothetical protein
MASAINRVVLITIDSVRYDRLGYGGNSNACSPVLDRLALNGISCSRAYAHGFCSQLSYPSIFTSSLPLDFGGYDRGILTRPRSLPEVLREDGFITAAFSSDPLLLGYYGYPRGFDEFHDLSEHGVFWDSLRANYLDYYRGLRERGEITDDEYRDTVRALLEGVLSYLSQVDGGRGQPMGGRRAAAREWEGFRRRARAELDALRQDSAAYIDRQLGAVDIGRPAGARGVSYDLLRRATRGARAVLKRYRPEDGLYRRFAPLASRLGFDPARLRGRWWAHSYPSAVELLALARRWLTAHGDDRSFLWVCLNDVHEGYTASSVWSPSLARPGAGNARVPAEEWPSVMYDRSVAYLDRAIGDFVAFLSAAGLLDGTLLVVCADHGQAVSSRDRDAAMAGEASFRFAEHISHVPLLFSHPGLSPRVVEAPCGLVDVAPTILDLLAMPPEPAFRGRPVGGASAGGPRWVVLENVGGGPCDRRHKPLQLCVVGDCYKYIWAEGGREELYDLASRRAVATAGDGVLDAMRSVAMARRSEILAAEKRR